MKKKRIRDKDMDPILLDLLNQQAKLTQRWYARISGQVPWREGERKEIDDKHDTLSGRIRRRMGELAAEEFARLPD